MRALATTTTEVILPGVTLREATATDAPGLVEVIHTAFGARPPLDPPATAITETIESVREALTRGGGIYANVAGAAAGSVLVAPADQPGVAILRRVSVHPDFQRHGIASAMVTAAERLAVRLGYRRLEVFARAELPQLVGFWQERGFVVVRELPPGIILGRPCGTVVTVPTADDMRTLGVRLAGLLRRGDVLIASGDLGAGKTTMAQGLGDGLDSEGPVTSPTFVLARVHASRTGRPPLVHVDAYRLSHVTEVDDLDLDTGLTDAVTFVEWGRGLAEGLADDRLEIDIARSTDPDDDTRSVLLSGRGRRWADVDLAVLTGAP